jgi:hypothetical protein
LQQLLLPLMLGNMWFVSALIAEILCLFLLSDCTISVLI